MLQCTIKPHPIHDQLSYKVPRCKIDDFVRQIYVVKLRLEKFECNF
jgi:hypothetical protein